VKCFDCGQSSKRVCFSLLLMQTNVKYQFPGNPLKYVILPRIRFYLQLSPRCAKMNKKSMWEVKKISRFLSTGYQILPSCGCNVHETVVAKGEHVL